MSSSRFLPAAAAVHAPTLPTPTETPGDSPLIESAPVTARFVTVMEESFVYLQFGEQVQKSGAQEYKESCVGEKWRSSRVCCNFMLKKKENEEKYFFLLLQLQLQLIFPTMNKTQTKTNKLQVLVLKLQLFWQQTLFVYTVLT